MLSSICDEGENFVTMRTRDPKLVDKRGESGRVVMLKANYVEIQHPDDSVYLQYHVQFAPNVESKSVRQEMLSCIRKDLGGADIVFDGTILYLPLKSHQIEFVQEHPYTKESVTITLCVTAELRPGDHQTVTLLNVFQRRGLKLMDFVQIGRHHFDPKRSVTIPAHKMDVWPGFATSIRPYERDLLLNIDVIHKMMRVDSVLDWLNGEIRKVNATKESVTQELGGCSVMTRYNNRLYRVDDILWDKNPNTDSFETGNQVLTLAEYYLKQYNITVSEPAQPLLLSKRKKTAAGDMGSDIILVPEFCVMTGLTGKMRADQRIMQDVASFTRVSPQRRVDEARAYLSRLEDCIPARKLYQNWNLTTGYDLVSIRGRVLGAEEIHFGKGGKASFNPKSADWSRESRGQKPIVSMELQEEKWAIVFPNSLYKEAEKLFMVLKDVGKTLNITVEKPKLYCLKSDDVGQYVGACAEARKEECQMVVVVLPNDNKYRYDSVKKACCTSSPVPSQFILVQSIRRAKILNSICQKILIQMNCKLGGTPWKVTIPMKNAMIIGYDNYHDSSRRGKAVGAAVFSISSNFDKWYSVAKIHGDETEESTNLCAFIVGALGKYHEINQAYPNRIFLFRDGVGEGQIPVIFNKELAMVRTAIQNVYGGEAEEEGKLKLSFIIVNKRVNSRFFMDTGTGSFVNPEPGTIVDDVVTKHERYDFFLIPQAVNQGTVTPVSYNVIYDKSDLKPDQMHRLCWKLCHMYYNWQGTIRVPAPCQYAHKLAFLLSQSVHTAAHTSLSDTLFFL